jgi:hypothetical protein
VKIDIAFVRKITGSVTDATMAQTIIQMAHNLNMRAIAEGVETSEQLAYLRYHQCDEVQGYLLSHPLPLEELGALLVGGDPLILGRNNWRNRIFFGALKAVQEGPARNGVFVAVSSRWRVLPFGVFADKESWLSATGHPLPGTSNLVYQEEITANGLAVVSLSSAGQLIVYTNAAITLEIEVGGFAY